MPNTTRKTHEVLILGGGLAGSCAAFHLARAGREVLLLEKETQAHDKVCGEFLSAEALPLLHEMDIDPLKLGGKKIDRIQIYSRRFKLSISQAVQAIGISRRRLDEACLQSATHAGAKIGRGETATQIQMHSDFFEVETQKEKIRTKNLFLATGKHEVSGAGRRQGRESSAIGFKLQVRLHPSVQKKWADQLGMFFFNQGYGGFCPIEEDLFSFCWIVEKTVYQKHGQLEKLFAVWSRENARLANLLKNAEWTWSKPLSVANVPYGYIQNLSSPSAQKGFYRLGDQFAVIPSLTGFGMTLALFTAREASRNYLAEPNSIEPPLDHYTKTCTAYIQRRMKLAYPFHRLCQSPWLADLSVGALKFFPGLAKQIAKKLNSASS